jgi:hypothetical protein
METISTTDNGLLSELIDLGANRTDAMPPQLAAEESALRRVLDLSGRLLPAVECLAPEQLERLIRGVVRYGQLGRQTGGSVSPVIRLFAMYRACAAKADVDLLSAWIVENRNNPFEPYGSAVYGGARTADEYGHQQKNRRARAEQNMAREQLRQQQAGSLKAQIRADRATAQLRRTVERGDLRAVEALLNAQADWRRVVAAGGPLRPDAEARGHDDVVRLLERCGSP